MSFFSFLGHCIFSSSRVLILILSPTSVMLSMNNGRSAKCCVENFVKKRIYELATQRVAHKKNKLEQPFFAIVVRATHIPAGYAKSTRYLKSDERTLPELPDHDRSLSAGASANFSPRPTHLCANPEVKVGQSSHCFAGTIFAQGGTQGKERYPAYFSRKAHDIASHIRLAHRD